MTIVTIDIIQYYITSYAAVVAALAMQKSREAGRKINEGSNKAALGAEAAGHGGVSVEGHTEYDIEYVVYNILYDMYYALCCSMLYHVSGEPCAAGEAGTGRNPGATWLQLCLVGCQTVGPCWRTHAVLLLMQHPIA